MNKLDKINSSDLLESLKYVANECQKHPHDSVRDILNEAFEHFDLPIYAEWSDDPDCPIYIKY